MRYRFTDMPCSSFSYISLDDFPDTKIDVNPAIFNLSDL